MAESGCCRGDGIMIDLTGSENNRQTTTNKNEQQTTNIEQQTSKYS
jgi:hypothetical protein